MRRGTAALLVLGVPFSQVTAIYAPLREYAGGTFFQGWDYWGTVDNTTWGNVTFLNQPDAAAHHLTYVNAAGNAIIKVDNTTNIADAPLVNRPSVRITSQDSYGVGTLWIIDVLHLPYGCSVWPSFWSLGVGDEWPNKGEIDIIEGINLMDHNQVALHSTPGCVQASKPDQTGNSIGTADCSRPQGCIVAESKPNSFGRGFAQAGGGVWALQMDVSGIFIWFWSRPDIPKSISGATSTSSMDITTFGIPSASYPASGCNITQFFGPQQLVLLITLCGVWGGVPGIYSSTCPGTCINNIIGPGSPTYDNAYFEIAYLRTYITTNVSSTSTSSTSPPAMANPTQSVITTVITSTVAPTGNLHLSSSIRALRIDFVPTFLGIMMACTWLYTL